MQQSTERTHQMMSFHACMVTFPDPWELFPLPEFAFSATWAMPCCPAATCFQSFQVFRKRMENEHTHTLNAIEACQWILFQRTSIFSSHLSSLITHQFFRETFIWALITSFRDRDDMRHAFWVLVMSAIWESMLLYYHIIDMRREFSLPYLSYAFCCCMHAYILVWDIELLLSWDRQARETGTCLPNIHRRNRITESSIFHLFIYYIWVFFSNRDRHNIYRHFSQIFHVRFYVSVFLYDILYDFVWFVII